MQEPAFLINALNACTLVCYIAVYIIGEQPGALLFHLAVSRRVFRVGPQIIPKTNMPFQLRGILWADV